MIKLSIDKIILSIIIVGFVGCNNAENEKNYSVFGKDTVLTIRHKGKLQESYKMSNNQKSGFYKLYDKKENLKEEGMIFNNLKEGVVKIYDDSKLISVSFYEKSVKLFDLDKDDFIYDTVKLESFNICLPKNWDKKIDSQEGVILISNKKCDSSEVFCPVLSITKETTTYNLKDYVFMALENISSSANKLKILNQNNFILNEINIFQVRYMMNQQGKKLGFQTSFFKLGDELFIITGTALNEKSAEFLKYDGLFEEILLSIHI